MSSVSQYDLGMYAAPQTARGTAWTGHFKTAAQYVKASSELTSKEVKGQPGLGSGMWIGPSVEAGFEGQWSGEGRVTLKRLPIHIFGMDCDMNTSGAVGNPQRHRFTPKSFTGDLPWWTLAFLYGQRGNAGTSIATAILQDCRISNWSLTYDVKDAMRFKQAGVYLQEGPPSGSETYDAAEVANIAPAITSPSHTFGFSNTVLDWSSFTSGLCLNSMTISKNAQVTATDACANGTGEPSDILVSEAALEIMLRFQYNQAAQALYNVHHYKTLTPAAGTRAKRSGYTSVDFDFGLYSNELMGTTAPMNVPYGFLGHLPLQIVDCKRNSDNTPQMLEVKATTYQTNPQWYFDVINDLTDAQMLWAA